MHLNKSEILCSADTLVKHVYISSVLHTGANSILLKAEKFLMSKEVPLYILASICTQIEHPQCRNTPKGIKDNYCTCISARR